MATFADDRDQTIGAIRTYTIDVSPDLPSGGTLTAGTAVHTPPSGSASTLTTQISNPYANVTMPAQTVTGVHYIDFTGTLNTGDNVPVRIPINVVYRGATARPGMGNLISELRGLTEAGADDYKIAGEPYWTDAQLQDILDIHRNDIIFEPLKSYPVQVAGGSLSWQDYRSQNKYYEGTTGGTAVFYIQDSTGATAGSAGYTPDYRRGQIQFNSNQGGTAYYLTGRSYDLNAAAADIWRRKTAHVAPTSFNFSTDNHSISRAAVYDHSKEMAEHFESKSGNAISTVPIFRSDVY